MCTGIVGVVLRHKILGNRQGILTQILLVMPYYFFFIYFKEVASIQKKKKHLLRNIFGIAHTSKRIDLLRNRFSNYARLKGMYTTLKGIGKTLFVSDSRILLICNFLNFAAVFTKKNKLTLCEMCPNAEFFLVGIFKHSD